MNNLLTISMIIQRKMNLKDIDGLIVNTYVFAVIAAVIMLALAILIASSIKYQPGPNPKDSSKRKLWFWILAILTPVSFYMYNLLLVTPGIKAGPAMNKFFMHSALSPVVSFVLFLILGITISKLFKRKKVGTWFNK